MYRKLFKILKYFLFISIFFNTYYLYNNRILVMMILFVVITILVINDYIRNTKLAITFGYMYDSSLLFTIFVASVLTYFIRGFAAPTYLLFPLKELLQLKGIRLKTLFSVHFLLYMILVISDIGMPNNWNTVSTLVPILLSYLATTATMYSIIIIGTEKEEVNQLNKKLQQYSLEVEELTVSKERTMMAQELHDSVGHSLMALVMHLEFAEKICDAKPEKVKEILIKSEDIAKCSVNSLREVVNLFKKEREIETFNHSIDSIINNFYLINNIKFNFSSNGDLDNLSLIIKNSIYKTIKESITNSIKHGQATEINIIISMKNNSINLILTDNGIGCNKIIKSNGLLGIENRLTSLNGSVNYFSNDNFGFETDISIPILMEEIII